MPTENPSQSPSKVLLVEDDRAVLSILRLLLERRGCEVRVAQTLDQAKSQLDPSVQWLILDLVLPDGDGADLIDYARQQNLQTQVTVLTGIGEGSRMEAVKKLRPQKILHKPADFSELLGVLGVRDV